MVRIASFTDIDLLDGLIQRYVDHQIQVGVTLDTVKKQMIDGVVRRTHQILIDEDYEGETLGFLVINLNSDRLPVLFANWNFDVERRLLDSAFEKLSPTATHISFESGWPTPWLSDELTAYAVELGFVKYGRGYMQLHPINKEFLSNHSIGNDFEFVPFSASMIDDIAKLIYKSVDGTADQDIWPSYLISVQKVAEFLNNTLEGVYGKHEQYYSWVLKDIEQNVGACFLVANEETGFLMQIVIDPEYRGCGLGKALLCHSLHMLLRVNSSITKFELAVTLSNPATSLYESLGFRILNNSFTFVWKQ